MFKRTLTACLLIPPVLYVVCWSPWWLFLLVVVAAVELGLREFFALCGQMGLRGFEVVGYIAGAAVCVGQLLRGIGCAALGVSLLLVLIVPALGLRPSVDLRGYLVATAVTLFGVFYIGLTLSCLLAIRFSLPPAWINSLFRSASADPGPAAATRVLLLLFLVIWVGDTCAFLVGRPLGRTPFFARISPRKTWEGALAGLAGSLLIAWGFSHWFWETADLRVVLLIAGGVAVAAQCGDLVESALKRGAQQKDSGHLLPGHGGFLDRIDSLLFAAPALWLVLVAKGILG